MNSRIQKEDLGNRVAQRLGVDAEVAGRFVDATLEEIYQAIKNGECVSLRNLGTFYVRPERASWVFRFNPSPRLRKLFGWSSTYKGEL
ncbi:MAG: HU family DNA-binding protein [Chloroflexi bacterium]|nr:HU family DNA-binding protein [Chloroflexota bacterium]MBU1748965.1 HU family DNA-binding protein [Chloroflexota bacterium]